jgi:hypothetical protein
LDEDSGGIPGIRKRKFLISGKNGADQFSGGDKPFSAGCGDFYNIEMMGQDDVIPIVWMESSLLFTKI